MILPDRVFASWSTNFTSSGFAQVRMPQIHSRQSRDSIDSPGGPLVPTGSASSGDSGDAES